jgi:hypothetical protein
MYMPGTSHTNLGRILMAAPLTVRCSSSPPAKTGAVSEPHRRDLSSGDGCVSRSRVPAVSSSAAAAVPDNGTQMVRMPLS